MSIALVTLKQGLLLFWSLWLVIVTLTNVFSWLKALRILPENWKFTSGNYRAIRDALAKYEAPDWFAIVLFAGAILWEAIATLFFWIAFVRYPEAGAGPVLTAFAILLALFAAFMLFDEVLREYKNENDHLTIFIGLLVTLLVILLLV